MWIWSEGDFLCSEELSGLWWMLKGDITGIITDLLTHTFVEQVVSSQSVCPFASLDVFKMSVFLVNTSECLSSMQFIQTKLVIVKHTDAQGH